MASFFAVEERSVAFGLYSAAIASRGAARSAASVAASTAPPLAGSGAAAPAKLKAEKPKPTAAEVKAVGSIGAGAPSGAGVPAKKKYVPPVVAEAPRKRRAPPSGVRLPIPGQRNVLITSALPYVNNVPHLGNIIGCVLSADVYARYCRQRGVNCVYICGTDEYGTATETKAAEEGLTPRQVCDKYYAQHASIYEWFDIAFDHFGRTSTPDPAADKEWPQTVIAQGIFKDLLEAGQLQEQTVEQVYCNGCTKFLADRFIEGECPLCHYDDARGDQCDKCGKLLNATELLKPRCKANAAHEVELRTSKHLFLDLPKLEPALREWVTKSSAGGAWTDNAVGVTESWLKKGLAPRCITRDLKWGTPVPHPDFSDKVFYVWFDAPIGYISITATYTPEWKQWWLNPDQVKLYQFMGKDNVPFHTVIFPSTLIGTGEPWTLLSNLSTTEYLNYEGGKFSKSRGVGVFGDSARDTGIPSEVWRYYLLASRPETSDSMFTWKDFAERNNGELLKNLGNLVQRLLAFAHATYGGTVPGVEAPLNERDAAFVEAVNGLLAGYISAMEEVKLRAALFQVMLIGMEANKYVQDSAPWDRKTDDPPRCATAVTLGLSAVRLISTLAEPFMPGFTDKVVGFLNLEHSQIPDTFGVWEVPAGHAINKPTPLFNAISEEQLDSFRARFGAAQPAASPVAAGSPAAGAGAAPSASAAPASKPAAAAGGKKGGAAAASAAPALPDAARVDLRVGTIVNVWPHPEADKLWCEEIDVGEDAPRRIASGLRPFYTQEQMLERRVLVVCNLKPRTMVGFESQGMVLCASNADRSTVEFVEPPAGARNGERITIPGVSDDTTPCAEVVNPAKKNNPWVPFAAELRTDASKIATYKGIPLTTTAGPCTAPTVAEGPIS